MYYGYKKGRIVVVSLKAEKGKLLVDCLCGNKSIEIAVQNLQRDYPTCTLCNTKEKHPLTYKSYDSMLQRCLNVNSPDYPNYGGRGITVCAEWRKDFYNFLYDIGERPSESMTLDRIDCNGNYSKENCRWADKGTQATNKRRKNMSFVKGAWQVYVTLYGVSTYIGRFKTEKEANEAIKLARGEY